MGLNNSTTLALWINTESKGTVALLSKYNAAGTGAGHIFRLSGGRPQLVLGGMDSQTYPPMATGTVKVNDGNWHHVTVVITVGEGIQFYVDGVAAGSRSTRVVGGGDGTSNLNLGVCQWVPFGGYFNGMMDEVEVYDRALSASEVNSVYLLSLQ